MQAEAASLLSVHRPPPSALRVLARRDDSQILILHGEERPIMGGERLAHILWLPSVGISEEVSRFCSDQLKKAQMPPDAEGWHNFAVEHLLTLINLAKTHLNVTIHPPAEPAPKERQAWTGKRIARLATMACEGYTAKMIAEDPAIRSTPSAVYRAAHRFDIWLSEKPRGQVNIRLPLSTLAFYERAAEPQGVTRDACIRRFLIARAEEAAPKQATFMRSVDSTRVRGELVQTT